MHPLSQFVHNHHDPVPATLSGYCERACQAHNHCVPCLGGSAREVSIPLGPLPLQTLTRPALYVMIICSRYGCRFINHRSKRLFVPPKPESEYPLRCGVVSNDLGCSAIPHLEWFPRCPDDSQSFELGRRVISVSSDNVCVRVGYTTGRSPLSSFL